MDDERIIKLYFNRDEDAIARTSEKYGPYCFRVAENILYDHMDSEECVNDTWLKTWDSIPPKRPQVLKIFLAKITRSLAFNRYTAKYAKKRGGGEIALVLDELSECIGTGDPASEFELCELGETVNEFLKSLPETDRNIFLRRCFYTESVEQVAKRYSMTGAAVMNRLSRTRKKLKQYLMKEGFLNEHK